MLRMMYQMHWNSNGVAKRAEITHYRSLIKIRQIATSNWNARLPFLVQMPMIFRSAP